MITYYLTLSQVFPSTHARAGEPTGFEAAFRAGQVFNRGSECLYRHPKLHTIRANYDFWAKRFEKIAAGEACLSIRQWTGKPYRSKQVELARLTREDGIGIQELHIVKEKLNSRPIWLGYVDGNLQEGNLFFPLLAGNDGLLLDDWKEWFKGYNFSKPLAIIHFTKFRY